jgi:hypothetical protein
MPINKFGMLESIERQTSKPTIDYFKQIILITPWMIALVLGIIITEKHNRLKEAEAALTLCQADQDNFYDSKLHRKMP